MKATIKSIKKVVCVAAVFSTLGFSLFASPKADTTNATDTVAIEKSTVSIPKTADLRTVRGKIKISKKKGVVSLTFTSVSDKKYSIVVVDPLIEEDLIDIKNKKIFLSGYVDDENGVFYVTKIGHLPATGNSSDAK